VDGVWDKERRSVFISKSYAICPGASSNWHAPAAVLTSLTLKFEPSADSIRYWLKQAGLDEGLRADGLTRTERKKLNRLRPENRVLREEHEILSKSPGLVRLETSVGSSRRSNS
jgi:transposase-like protein